MRKIKDTFKDIYENHKRLIGLMSLLLIFSIALLIFSLVSLKSDASVVKIGYGDIGRYQGGDWSSMANSGGYRDGAWNEMFSFVILSLVFGILHNLISIKIFEKKGEGLAMFFIIFTIAMIIATFIVEIRL